MEHDEHFPTTERGDGTCLEDPCGQDDCAMCAARCECCGEDADGGGCALCGVMCRACHLEQHDEIALDWTVWNAVQEQPDLSPAGLLIVVANYVRDLTPEDEACWLYRIARWQRDGFSTGFHTEVEIRERLARAAA